MEFHKKVVLVTGSGNGIGRAIAMTFAAQGASVIVIDIDGHSADKTRNDIKNLGGEAISYKTDVTKKAEVVRLFADIKESYGTLDILINNVGTNIRKPVIEYSEQEWDFLIDTNLKSMFMCTQEAGMIMLKQRSGIVVNISSIHGLSGIPKRLPYSTAKAAVDSFTKTVACEWGYDGVRVNAIAPGYIVTDGLQAAFDTGILSEADMIRRTPQGHLGTPQNIADAVMFLSSEKAAFITGAVLYVDGGYAAYHAPEPIPSFHHNL
jgi:3-oxoacyl-[acyl-carrier protein] reductase